MRNSLITTCFRLQMNRMNTNYVLLSMLGVLVCSTEDKQNHLDHEQNITTLMTTPS